MKTRKILSLVLALLTIISCVSFTAGADPLESELQNLYLKLNEDPASVKVAYFGGSITYGNGASNRDVTSWRARVGTWFKDNYPNVTFENVNAGVGATGSYFGAYRYNKDVIGSTGAPDLLFVEMAINDLYDNRTEAETKADVESIIRQAYKSNPNMEIILLYTTDFARGATDYSYLTWHKAVADYYGIKSIYLGAPLWNQVVSENGGVAPTVATDPTWRKYITDDCHPTDVGYEFYANLITTYLGEQLGTNVSHTATDYEPVTLPATTLSDSSLVKLNGNCSTFTEAGFTWDKLNGWVLSGSEIKCQDANSSFAFQFTGTSVGFLNNGKTTCGDIEYTITKVSDPAVKYTGTSTMRKNYTTYLTFPCEFKRGLPLDTYKVECVVKNSGNGSDGYLSYIYIDGDKSSIVPLSAPATIINYVAISNREHSAVYNGVYGGIVPKSGYNTKLFTPTTTATTSVEIDNWGYSTSNILFPQYKYVSVNYYFENPNNSSTATQIGFMPTQVVGNTDWVYSTASMQNIESNKWATAVFDISDFSNFIAANYPGKALKQAYLLPFGNSVANTLTNGEKIYIASVTFHSAPPVKIYGDADGNRCVYVSATGSVTIGADTFGAYTNFPDALTRIADLGGHVYFQGTFSSGFTDIASRGAVTVRGVGTTPESISSNIITKSTSGMLYMNILGGDIKFDYMTFNGYADELWIATNGKSLTFGSNVKVVQPTTGSSKGGLYIAPSTYGTSCLSNANVYFNSPSAIYSMVAAASPYSSGSKTYNGDVYYEFNAGTFYEIYAGSRNGSTGNHITNGNVKFVFNGGTYNYGIYGGSSKDGQISGNVIFEVNGGTYAGNFYSGNYNGNASNILGSVAIIVNSKTIKANSGSVANKKIGPSLYASKILGKQIYIINNSEENSGVSIDSASTAPYRLLVAGGKAYPVFENGTAGALKGFTMTSDTAGYVPVIGGTRLTQVDDIYTIPENTTAGTFTNITFADPNLIPLNVTYDDGIDGNSTAPVIKTALPNATHTVVANTFTRSGYYFSGWSDGTSTFFPGDSKVITANVTLTALWTQISTINEVYLDNANGDDNHSGLSALAPFKTLAKAITVGNTLNSNAMRVVVVGSYTLDSDSYYTPTVNSTITISGKNIAGTDYAGQIKIKYGFSFNCRIIFENIQINPNINYGFMDSKGKTIVFGEGITNSSAFKLYYHDGLTNANATSLNTTIKSGSFANIFVGAYYNTTAGLGVTGNTNLLVNGGSIDNVIIGADGYNRTPPFSNATIGGNVLVTVNGGTISAISASRLDSIGGSAQFIFNNGVAPATLNSNLTATGGVYVVTSAATVGARVDHTATAGTFALTIPSGFTAVAVNGSTTQYYTVSGNYQFAAGTTAITYSDSIYLMNVGETPIAVDPTAETVTATIPAGGMLNFQGHTPKKEGKLFTGWYNQDDAPLADGSSVSQGEVLTAKFIDFVTEGNEANFVVEGVQVRTSGVQGLRFINKMAKSTLRDILACIDPNFIPSDYSKTDIGYGMIVFPTAFVPETGLFKDTSYTVQLAGGGSHTNHAKVVPAVKEFTDLHPSPESDYIYFTVVLTGITDYTMNYTVRPYITYKDASGVTHTVYGEAYSANVYNIAAAAYYSPIEDASTKTYLLEHIFENVEPANPNA